MKKNVDSLTATLFSMILRFIFLPLLSLDKLYCNEEFQIAYQL